MSKRFLLCSGLLVSLAPGMVSAQYTDVSQPQDLQNPSTGCETTVTGCLPGQSPQDLTANQTPTQPVTPLPAQPTGATAVRPTVTGTSTTENAPLGTQRYNNSSVIPLPAELPTEFQKFVAATTGQLLPIYGASLFRNVPSTFAPIDLAPVTSDYVIGPEDQLRVRIWGQISLSENLRVDRSGDIYLPQVGAIHVAGLQFSELDQHLRAAVGRIYRNFDLSVDVGQIRSIEVYVSGQARRPGMYTVSSLSTLVDALFASGGPSTQGSLRHIQLKRDGNVVADFDLYALLIHGDKSHDVRLLPEDVIYIAPVGHQAAITGSVSNPAIYELIDGETIGDLIGAAGNATTLASNMRISVERIGADKMRQAMEFPSDSAGLASPLADGDVLRIFPILPAYQKTVTLRGNVANPGRFNWHEGMHLSELIPDRDSLVTREYWWRRSYLGLPTPEFQPLVSDIGKNPLDPELSISGFTSSVTPDTLSAALAAMDRPVSAAATVTAGQAESSGSLASQTVQNSINPGTSGQGLAPQNLANQNLAAQNLANQSLGAKNFAVQNLANQNLAQELAKRALRNDVHLTNPEIDWDYAVIERLDPNTLRTTLIPFDLGKLVLNHDVTQDLVLEPSDTITIFTQADIHVPIDQQTKYIDLEGEIAHAGIYSVQPNETLRDVIRRAGGFTSKAYLYGSEFDRESTRVLQQQRLDEYVHTLTLESERGTQALAVFGTANGSSAADLASSRALNQDLITRLQQIRATGRIVFELQPDMSSIDDLPALTLENGDRFTIPTLPVAVNVVGAVYNQNSFLYHSGQTVGYYLKLAGGATRDADARRTFIIRADGSVIGRQTVKTTGAWSRGFDNISLNAGDTLVIPDKALRPTALRGFIDTTQIFEQLALGAAAIHAF